MLVIFSCNGFSQSQFYLSEVWDMEGGTMPIFYKNASTTDDQRNVYVVGSTNNGSNGNDILIQKFNKLGDLLWEQSFNGGANAEDIGADIFVDASYNVYVTGGATQTTQNNLDLVVLKYNSSGVLQWSYFYNFGGSPIPYDGGTAITGDNNGSIYVTGTSAGTNTMTDFVTIKLNSSNGTQVWTSRYDFAQLNEVPSKIRVSGSSIIVTGASQSTQTPSIKWELATVRYNSSNGSQVGLSRTGGNSSSGIDEANDLTIDNNGNVYVVGATNNQNTGYDITILKFNDDLQLLWQQTFNGHGLEDKGYGIKTDAQGNVYAVGYVTNPNQGKNYSILKYNSAGTLQWSREFNGLANQDDEAVQLVVRGDRIFVTGAARNGTYSDIVTMGYTADGEIFSVKSFESPFGLNDKPTAIGIDLDDNLVIVGQIQQASNSYRNVTFKYNVWEKPIIPVYIDSVPVYNQNELIVRFDRSAMNYSAVNKKDFEAGELRDFVHQYVIDSLNARLPFDAGRLTTYKIFCRMTTADTISVTRLGDTVKIDDFWATLSIMLPDYYSEHDAADSLMQVTQSVHYAEVNYFGEFFSVPNDNLYSSGQSGLYNATHGINLQNAWGKQVGQNFIKVGVYDTGINWRHEDFGDASWDGTKIKGGYDYYTHAFVSNQDTPDPTGHGTAVSGVLGALRNNNLGVAGVAGGDYQIGNTGCQLFSMGIAIYLPVEQINTVISLAIPAIIEGAVHNPNTGYGYGLHIQNHSWGSYSNSMFLRNAVKTCYEQNCTFVAGSGNKPEGSARYPASYKDNWVMKVGANNATGHRVNWSTFGNNLDFIAPGTADILSTLLHNDNSGYISTPGTSFSAPHVSGVAALLYSQHNPITHIEYPNFLAPDDVEMMLKKYATPIYEDLPSFNLNLPIPNDYAGYGRINAGESMIRTSLPYRIHHFTQFVNTSSATLHATGQLVEFPENIQNLPLGAYPGFSDVYKVQVTLYHNIPSSETYLDGWVRNSTCDLFGITSSITNPHWSDVMMINSNQTSATLVGYIYKTKIYNSLGQHIQDRWFPVDLYSNVRFSYSIYTIDDNPNVGLESNNENVKIFLFPNPTASQLTLIFDTSLPEIFFEILDVSGRQIATYNYTNLETGLNQQTIDVTDYQNGLYFCRFYSGNDVITSRFIKN